MAFDYAANVTTLVDVLKAHNTSTASPDLSGSLSSRIVDANIVASDPDFQIMRGDRYPMLFVRLSDAQEEFAGIGNTGPTGVKKQKVVSYDIFGFYRKQGAGTSREALLDEVYTLARNIEGVLQANTTLRGTAMWCNPRSATFANMPFDDGVWVKTVLVELEAKYFFR